MLVTAHPPVQRHGATIRCHDRLPVVTAQDRQAPQHCRRVQGRIPCKRVAMWRVLGAHYHTVIPLHGAAACAAGVTHVPARSACGCGTPMAWARRVCAAGCSVVAHGPSLIPRPQRAGVPWPHGCGSTSTCKVQGGGDITVTASKRRGRMLRLRHVPVVKAGLLMPAELLVLTTARQVHQPRQQPQPLPAAPTACSACPSGAACSGQCRGDACSWSTAIDQVFTQSGSHRRVNFSQNAVQLLTAMCVCIASMTRDACT